MSEEIMRQNNSGWLPVEYKVLCKVDPAETSTRGGIIIPSQVSDKQKRERVVVTLVACGGRAFQDPEWGEPVPKIGDRVRVAKYAGDLFDGKDGESYLMLVDKNIEGVETRGQEP